MIKVKSIAIGVAIVASVIVATIAVSILNASIPTWEERFASKAGLPLRLVEEGTEQGAARGEILLQRGGVALLKDVPVGTLGQAGDYCTNWDGSSTFTGEAEWSTDSDSAVTITTKNGDAWIGPYAPPFSDLAWYRFGLPLCGEDQPLWYRTAAD